MKNSAIEWTDHTFNPWEGCTKVSPGCLHCYAATRDQRWHGGAHWGKGAPRRRTSVQNWNQVLRWDSESADAIAEGVLLDKNIRRARVFCASLADWLDDEIPIEWLCDLLALIRRTPNLDWLLLTKRPENFRPRLIKAYVEPAASADTLWVQDWTNGSVYDNIWVGTTVEDQNRAPGRIAALKAIPATVHFLSCEPLLEEIGIQFELKGIDWVICGGESGPGARPMNPMWAQDLMCQCKVERVPFFMKQLGGVTDKRHRLDQLPEYLRVRQFP